MAVFTTITKPRHSWPAPAVTAAGDDKFLLIGGGFYLLIGGGYKLIITSGSRAETPWTRVSKSR